MPRIVPLQLLKCLKVLLDDNGGILSAGEVKRIAGLMTKYSKKLVSKCIYVQILKCTKTELLGEFMSVGGWTLVYTWLNDAIRAMNWPLVQEILELLLLCPVDVHRLKINSAPKLVKGLCKDGGNEGVRILAKRLVEQWLKVVTENNSQTDAGTVPVAQQTSSTPTVAHQSDIGGVSKANPAQSPQKKSNETGLVYKIIVKNGQQVLAKVPKTVQDSKFQVSGSESKTTDDVQNDNTYEEVPDETELVEETGDDGVEVGDAEISEDRTQDGYSDDNQVKSERKNNDFEQKNKDRRISKDKEQRERDRKNEKDKKTSSKSSLGHKHSSTSSKQSTSSSKSSSSKSSSSHRSSSDKHRSDKDRSSSSNSSRDRSSSSSSKHKSSSSTTTKTLSSSANTKDRHRSDKDRLNLSSSQSKKEKEREMQAEKDKDTLAKLTSSSLEKLGKIPKKSLGKDVDSEPAVTDAHKSTSITIPSKKASISIEIRKDTEKAKTVKTYKSQFRSHGLNEEAPPPPSRKGLKKPGSTTAAPGTIIPSSLPSSLKRSSPPPRDSLAEKKPKIDMNNISVTNEKPGAIKLIAPKKMQTLIETNLFSEALSAATGPKKAVKRKRPVKSEGASPPTSPDVPKVAPLKFYQDTLDESKSEEGKSDKENEDNNNSAKEGNDNQETDAGTAVEEEDEDLPLKRVKEVIEQKVQKEKKSSLVAEGDPIDNTCSESDEALENDESNTAVDVKKPPGPGCGPDGPPGVLMLHRRKGPKKQLTWRPQEQLEEVRYFELDETERVNVTKTPSSFNDMKNLERFGERDAINIARRGFNHEDNMEPQTPWRALIELENVPPHPDGCQSKEREVQAKRESTTLRALYFSHAMIPESATEAEIEPHFAYDVPIIPLDDLTGNPDAVNDFTSMPWPEPRGSPKNIENVFTGTGGLTGLGSSVDMLATVPGISLPGHNQPCVVPSSVPANPFGPFLSPFNSAPGNLHAPQQQPPLAAKPLGIWQGPPSGPPPQCIIGPGGYNGSPNMDIVGGALGPMNGPPPQMMMGQYGISSTGAGPYYINEPSGDTAGSPPMHFKNSYFGPMGGPGGANVVPIMNNGSMGIINGPPPGSRNNNRGGGGWRSGGPAGGGSGWRPAGSGHNRGNMGSTTGGNNSNNNGVCKAFLRGHCRLGKTCKFIHPSKNKRI